MNHDLLIKSLEASQKGQNYATATIVETTLKGTPRKAGSKMVVWADGSLFGSIGGGVPEKNIHKECLRAIKTQKTALITYDFSGKKGQPICGGQIKVLIEPFKGLKNFIICGAGHIALPLSIIAKLLQFNVTILDNRKSFANKRRFPHADHIFVGNPGPKLSKIPINTNTYIMIVTHEHKYDFSCLRAVAKSSAAYIGVIASKRKRTEFLQRLKKSGFSAGLLRKISIPAGIDIGAQTPAEIALSVMAEIVTQENLEFIGSGKFKDKSQF